MRLLPFLLVAFSCLPIQAQQVVDLSTSSSGDFINAPVNQETEVARRPLFRVAMRKAVRSALKDNEISRDQAQRLNDYLWAPSFRRTAERIAVAQMGFSTQADVLPVDTEGKIQTTSINWDKWIAFLQKLIPILLDLLEQKGL